MGMKKFGEWEVGQLLAVTIPYGVGLSALYLKAFWGAFGVDPFQYAGLPDIAVQALPTIILAAAGIGAGWLLGVVLSPAFLTPFTMPSWIKLQRDQPAERVARLSSHADILVGIGSAATAVAAALFVATPVKWPILAFTLSVLALSLSTRGSIALLLPNSSHRMWAVFGLITFPLLIYGNGVAHAREVLAPNGYFVERTRSKLPVAVSDSTVHLGTLGETTFLYELGRSELVVLRASDATVLVLSRRPGTGTQKPSQSPVAQ